MVYDTADRPEAARSTFIDPVTDALRSATELAARLRAVADRLCGPVPPTASNAIAGGKLASVPNGVFDEVSDLARQIGGAQASAHESLNRIERMLP